jgi:hypothetical protein
LAQHICNIHFEIILLNQPGRCGDRIAVTAIDLRAATRFGKSESWRANEAGGSPMSIFNSIRDAIFGSATPAAPAAAGGKMAKSADAGANAGDYKPTVVDVDAVLSAKAAAKGGTLNYRGSIVDLMKSLDMDSSLDNRKELARELGYTGALDGSAEMNIWLHKAVMKQLAAHGGQVPAELLD